MLTSPAVSIIIPHYNSVETVLTLLKSIPEDPRFEVLVVDDRSSADISALREALPGDQRRLLLNDRPNKGAGTARNIGLEQAGGEWLLFADADDYFMDGWTEKVTPWLDSEVDEVFFSPTSFNLSTQTEGVRHRHYAELVNRHSRLQTERTEIELRYGFYTPWSKLIRRKVFTEHGIRFEEQMVANDVMAMTQCAYYSCAIQADPGVIYCVTCRNDTLTSKKNPKNFDIRIDTKIRRYHFLQQRLSRRHFRWTHADYYMTGSLVDSFLSKQAPGRVLKKYRENGIPLLTLSTLNPAFLLRHAASDLSWRKEVSGRK